MSGRAWLGGESGKGRAMIAKLAVLLMLAAAICGLARVGGLAHAGEVREAPAVWQAFAGQIVVSDTHIARRIESDEVRIASLHMWQRRAITGSLGGSWRMHLLAFLRR